MTNHAVRSSDLRLACNRYALRYVQGASYLFALICKAGSFTSILIITKEQMETLVRKDKTNKLFSRNELFIRWKGGMINKVKPIVNKLLEDNVPEIRLNIPYSKFSIGSNGTRSDAVEVAIMDTLNAQWALTGTNAEFKWVAYDHTDTYDDLANEIGTTIQVKGVNGCIGYR